VKIMSSFRRTAHDRTDLNLWQCNLIGWSRPTSRKALGNGHRIEHAVPLRRMVRTWSQENVNQGRAEGGIANSKSVPKTA